VENLKIVNKKLLLYLQVDKLDKNDVIENEEKEDAVFLVLQ
jgi:hypothetical protein